MSTSFATTSQLRLAISLSRFLLLAHNRSISSLLWWDPLLIPLFHFEAYWEDLDTSNTIQVSVAEIGHSYKKNNSKYTKDSWTDITAKIQLDLLVHPILLYTIHWGGPKRYIEKSSRDHNSATNLYRKQRCVDYRANIQISLDRTKFSCWLT